MEHHRKLARRWEKDTPDAETSGIVNNG